MRIIIDPEVLQRENLTLGEYFVLLMAYTGLNYKESLDSLVAKGKVQPNLFDKMSVVLSDNDKDYITDILLDSNPRVKQSGIDFNHVAKEMQNIYPAHKKPGTSYDWRGTTYGIARKLKTTVAVHGFNFTEEEALNATQEYVESFGEDKTKMRLLKYFILRTDGKNKEIDSPFMTIIENNRYYDSNIR